MQHDKLALMFFSLCSVPWEWFRLITSRTIRTRASRGAISSLVSMTPMRRLRRLSMVIVRSLFVVPPDFGNQQNDTSAEMAIVLEDLGRLIKQREARRKPLSLACRCAADSPSGCSISRSNCFRNGLVLLPTPARIANLRKELSNP